MPKRSNDEKSILEFNSPLRIKKELFEPQNTEQISNIAPEQNFTGF